MFEEAVQVEKPEETVVEGYEAETEGATEAVQNVEEAAAEGEYVAGEDEPIDLEAVQKIQEKMPISDPDAPVGSNKNPIRIIQQGNQYIATQDLEEDHLQQIIQVLTNQALLTTSTAKPSAIYNKNTNKRIVFRVTRAKRKKPKDEEADDASSVADSLPHHHSRDSISEFGFSKRFRRDESEPDTEEEDPDFEPDLPEEEILPFPIIRKRTASTRVTRPPKHLVKDYKHLRMEDLERESDSEEDGPSDGGYSDYINGGGDSGDEEIKKKEFQCDICGQEFTTKAGLARHRGCKHPDADGAPSNRTRWPNPYMASVRRRNKLQDALATATDDDLIEFVAPRMAKILSPWDHLLMRSETGDPPLPHVPGLVFEYLSLAEQARAFLQEHLRQKEDNTPRKAGKDLADEETGEDLGECILRIDTEEQSGALGLPIGRYVVEQPLKEEFLPRRFRSILAAQRAMMEPGVGDENRPPSPLGKDDDGTKQFGLRSTKKAIVDVETGAASEAMAGGQRKGVLQTIRDPVLGDDVLLMEEGGLGHPVPEEWLDSGEYMSVLTESGAASDLVMDAATMKLYHRPTGHLVQLANSRLETAVPEDQAPPQASPGAKNGEVGGAPTGPSRTSVIDDETQQMVDIEAMFPGVSITDVSSGVAIISKPNGAKFQVEHGGDGITLSTLQTVLSLDDQG